jgi:hypothetical protein
VEGGGYGLLLRYNPGICLEELRKVTEDLTQDSSSHSKTRLSNFDVNYFFRLGLNSDPSYSCNRMVQWFLLLLRD